MAAAFQVCQGTCLCAPSPEGYGKGKVLYCYGEVVLQRANLRDGENEEGSDEEQVHTLHLVQLVAVAVLLSLVFLVLLSICQGVSKLQSQLRGVLRCIQVSPHFHFLFYSYIFVVSNIFAERGPQMYSGFPFFSTPIFLLSLTYLPRGVLRCIQVFPHFSFLLVCVHVCVALICEQFYVQHSQTVLKYISCWRYLNKISAFLFGWTGVATSQPTGDPREKEDDGELKQWEWPLCQLS